MKFDDGFLLGDMAAYFGHDIRRISHALKVFGFAKTIAAGENLGEAETRVLLAAAALHDIGIKNAEKKYGSSDGKCQELEGPPVVRKILARRSYGAAFTDRVCFLVGHHHTYGEIDGPDFQILVEADFLVNISEDGLSADAAAAVGQKIFKTATGKKLLNKIYGV